MLLCCKSLASPRNLTWFTRPLFLMRGWWGLGKRLLLGETCRGFCVLVSLVYRPSHVMGSLNCNNVLPTTRENILVSLAIDNSAGNYYRSIIYGLTIPGFRHDSPAPFTYMYMYMLYNSPYRAGFETIHYTPTIKFSNLLFALFFRNFFFSPVVFT